MSLSLWELVQHRLRKHGLYDQPAYWDLKASRYQGLARSNWPSNAYNERVHVRQMQIVDDVLGDVAGRTIADVGCGTGRAARHLAERGARVTGFDFSAKALEAARAESAAAGLDIRFEPLDVLESPPEKERARYDVVLTIGCLALACSNTEALDRALEHIVSLLRPGGRVLFLEPVHESRLLGRILRASVAVWISRGERAGLRLLGRGGLLNVAARYALAFRDLPGPVVDMVFQTGEAIVAASPRVEILGDYKWLFFEQTRSQ